MSVIDEVLEEEYDRSMRISVALEKEIASLPKGSLQIKHINGHDYYYLQAREGDRIVSKYVPLSQVETVRQQIIRRQEDIRALKARREDQKKLARVLGRKKHEQPER